MRWDSPFVLATAGTLAIHVLVAIAGDAVVLVHHGQPEPAPKIELIDVEVPPVVKPPPPPPVAKSEPEQPVPKPAVARHVAVEPIRQAPPPPSEVPPPPPSAPDPGGDEVVTIPDVAPAATGVAVRTGTPSGAHIGRGGTGGGTGSGSGTGSAAAPVPVSIATIKKPAMPRGDYSFESTRDYPLEAKQLGIEGAIRIRLIVDEHGKVKSTVLLNRLGHGLDELALKRAALIEFDPARDTEDRPVSSVVVWTFTMTLPK